jgi:hypothetical protein
VSGYRVALTPAFVITGLDPVIQFYSGFPTLLALGLE